MEYVLVTTSLAETGQTSLAIESRNVAETTGPSGAAPARSGAAGRLVESTEARPVSSDELHHRLRYLERTQLPIEVGGAIRTGSAEPDAEAAASPPVRTVVGDMLVLNAQATSACSDPKLVPGRVEAMSAHAVVVSDTANPPGGFQAADYRHFAAAFDTLVVPVTTEHFGSPSDIDGNGRVLIFFTREVNGLRQSSSETLTAGFFFSRDLFPRAGADGPLSSCEGSNESEILYLLVPDPLGLAGRPITKEAVTRLTTVTIGHEFQHLVNASQRLLGPQGVVRPLEETWLNEAMSHVMEELLFFRVSGLSPGQNLEPDDLGDEAIEAFNEFQRLNFFRFIDFLSDPGSNSPYDPDISIASRGAAWSFLRYSADRSGGDDGAFFRQLVTSPSTGLENLSAALGVSGALDWVGDWSVGLFADDRVSGLAERFQDRSWNQFSFFQSAALDGPYLTSAELATSPVIVRQLAAGGSGYFRFGVDPGVIARLVLSSDGGAPPSTLRVTVMRTR